MKITQAASVLLASLAVAGIATEAQANVGNADFDFSSFNKGGGVNGGNNGGNGGDGGNGGNAGNPGNINSTANVLQSPNSSASSTGSFVNLGGLNANFGDFNSSSVRIGAASCPKSALSFIGSGNYIEQDGDSNFDNSAYSASGAVVFSMPLTGKDGKRCSEYLQLQVDDLYYSQGLKGSKACVDLVKVGVTYFDPALYGERMSAICNSVAMQIGRPKEVQIKEVIKEVPVIKEIKVPVQVPVAPPLPEEAEKFGSLPQLELDEKEFHTVASALLW